MFVHSYFWFFIHSYFIIFTQRELSDKIALLGVDIYHSDISLIENEKLLLKDFEIVAFAKVLGVTFDQLFENTDNLFD